MRKADRIDYSLPILLMLLLLAAFPQPTFGKSFLSPNMPPLSVTLTKNYYHAPVDPSAFTTQDAEAMTYTVQSLGSLYNSTWRPALQKLLTDNGHSLDGKVVTGLGVYLTQYVSGMSVKAQYNYQAYVSNFTLSLPTNDPLIQRLMALNMTLGFGFGLTGYFVGAEGTDLFLGTPDAFVARLTKFIPQIVNITTDEMQDKSFGPFSSLQISVLDSRIIGVSTYNANSGLQYSGYLGLATAVSLVTTTVRSVSTYTETSTATSTVMSTVGPNPGASVLPLQYLAVLLSATTLAGALTVLVARRKGQRPNSELKPG
jgi:hypothetical protein